ncbi:telomerase Cajal body protein 1-like isoform X1 [Rhopilema esculentum]|uniref:telomerase Cajal body protein 1-like isoform X1 n=1 Tax=Rhopilema esculentum TaxID=499914 RepID=UPI0031DFCF1F
MEDLGHQRKMNAGLEEDLEDFTPVQAGRNGEESIGLQFVASVETEDIGSYSIHRTSTDGEEEGIASYGSVGEQHLESETVTESEIKDDPLVCAASKDNKIETDKDGTCEVNVDLPSKTAKDDIAMEDVMVSNETLNHEEIPTFEIDFGSKDFLNLVAGSRNEFRNSDDCFLKGCKWSPDGLCILTNSNDNFLRIFNIPTLFLQDVSSANEIPEELDPVLRMKEGEIVYDFDWYPLMSSYDHPTCCFISTSKDHPLHLWDAFTGDVRCSYVPKNHLDEVVAANSVTFSMDGNKIFCGFNKAVKVFDTNRPGCECMEYATAVKNTVFTQSGIISSIAFSKALGKVFALGSFGKCVGIYSEDDADLICMLPGKIGAVTQVQFSKDGFYLYAGARKNDEISCWDLRNLDRQLFTLNRDVATNQKVQFDIHWSDRYLFSGNTNGCISVWELEPTRPSSPHTFPAHGDAVNGISIHPYAPLVASTSGQRHFDISSSSDTEDSQPESIDNSLLVWRLSQVF